MWRLVQHILLLVQNKFLALRAVHIPGQLNLEAWVKAWRMKAATSDHVSNLTEVQPGRGSPLPLMILSFSSHYFWVRCSGSCMDTGLLKCLPNICFQQFLWQCGKTECISCWLEIKNPFWIQKPPVLECKCTPTIWISGAESAISVQFTA